MNEVASIQRYKSGAISSLCKLRYIFHSLLIGIECAARFVTDMGDWFVVRKYLAFRIIYSKVKYRGLSGTRRAVIHFLDRGSPYWDFGPQ